MAASKDFFLSVKQINETIESFRDVPNKDTMTCGMFKVWKKKFEDLWDSFRTVYAK